MGGKKNPFAGRRPADSNTKAPSLPKAKKQGAGKSGDGGPRKKKERSFWGLVGAVASFAAVWTWTLVNRSKAAKQQRLADARVLRGMLSRPLHFTEHASCRMDCRFINRSEVVETLRTGAINQRKSAPGLRPCPKYTVDATLEGKHVQAVFGACPAETNVITVIDLDTDWTCGPC